MSCILRVAASDFDVAMFLRDSVWSPCRVFKKGEPKWSSTPHKINARSGFNLEVSEADFDDLTAQIADAIAFLATFATEIERLKNFDGVGNITLDFGVEERDCAVQSDRFPVELLRLCGNSNVGICVTRYAK